MAQVVAYFSNVSMVRWSVSKLNLILKHIKTSSVLFLDHIEKRPSSTFLHLQGNLTNEKSPSEIKLIAIELSGYGESMVQILAAHFHIYAPKTVIKSCNFAAMWCAAFKPVRARGLRRGGEGPAARLLMLL